MAKFDIAREMDAELEIRMTDWNDLCWYGALWKQAKKVLSACEQAVTQAETQKELSRFRDSRGLARALTGDTAGGIEDFGFYVAQMRDGQEEKEAQRTGWIECLERGGNPFTDEVLESLK